MDGKGLMGAGEGEGGQLMETGLLFWALECSGITPR